MRYIKVTWPEVQDYMNHPDYQKEVSYDPDKDCWFVPEDWEPYDNSLGGDIGDLWG